jgi:tellurite resistance protein
MCAVDEEVRQIELEEVLGFIDRTALPPEDLAELTDHARRSIAHPPATDAVLATVAQFADSAAIARVLVHDLVLVAAADQRADARETAMLAAVCDTLNLPHVEIPVPGEAELHPALVHSPELRVTRRMRAQVRRALDESYAGDDTAAG